MVKSVHQISAYRHAFETKIPGSSLHGVSWLGDLDLIDVLKYALQSLTKGLSHRESVGSHAMLYFAAQCHSVLNNALDLQV